MVITPRHNKTKPNDFVNYFNKYVTHSCFPKACFYGIYLLVHCIIHECVIFFFSLSRDPRGIRLEKWLFLLFCDIDKEKLTSGILWTFYYKLPSHLKVISSVRSSSKSRFKNTQRLQVALVLALSVRNVWSQSHF